MTVVKVLDQPLQDFIHEQTVRSTTQITSHIFRGEYPVAEMKSKQLKRFQKSAREQYAKPHYCPDVLTDHQKHALEGTKWTFEDKAEPPRTYSRKATVTAHSCFSIFFLMMSVGLGFDGNLLMCLATLAAGLFTAAVATSNTRKVQAYFHNHRIARVDVSSIQKYELEGRLTNRLRMVLGPEQWQRLVAALRSDDQELRPVFTNFCEGETEYIRVFDQAIKLFEAEETQNNLDRINTIKEASADFTERLVLEITEIFERRDAEAAQNEQIAKDNEERAAAEAEHKQFVGVLQQSLDVPMKGVLLDAEVQFITTKY